MSTAPMAPPLLAVENLSVEFRTRTGIVRSALENINVSLAKGEIGGAGRRERLGQVGHRLRRDGHPRSGGTGDQGLDPLRRPRPAGRSEKKLRDLRGREISMIFQNPRAALNPIRPVGQQIADVLLRHARVNHADAPKKAIELLARSASPTRAGGPRPIRSSFRAACASAS